MLEATSSVEENRLGVDFAEIYRKSSLYQYVHFLAVNFVHDFFIYINIPCFSSDITKSWLKG